VSEAAPPDIHGLAFVRKLGSGGYADVFLYDQATPQRKVAVKVLRESGLSTSAMTAFTAEADAMAQLEHPYIVPVYATGMTLDHRPYIAMMYYPRPSLSERARTERFSIAETLQLGIQLGSAVETAHRAGLLHRDIKPANVLTSAYGRPGLTDFGIAGRIAEKEDEDVGVSVPWSPPEVLYATAPASIRSDVYSLGATLWHLLVGRSPFEMPGGDNSPFALMRRIRDVPPPFTGRPDVPASLDRLLRSAMSKEPAARPQRVAEFVGALQAIEQELRLPRTPLELAAEERPVRAAPTAGEDRTQVRAPQVIQPSATLPMAGAPIASFAADEVSAAETRRAAARVTPVHGFDADAEGRTVLRAVAPQPVAEADAPATRTPRRGLAMGLAGVVLVAIIGGGWALLNGSHSTQSPPEATVSAEPPDIGGLTAPPGNPEISCVNAAKSVTCSWAGYANALDSDYFLWRIKGTTDVHKTKEPKAEIPTRGSVCIEVKIYRQDTSYTPADWTKGGSCR
jgi:hypothetical protein